MLVLVFIGLIVFFYWSLVPAKPKQPIVYDLFKESDRNNLNYSNVFRHKYTGIYYSDKEPINSDDIKVFTGTVTECESYANRNNRN